MYGRGRGWGGGRRGRGGDSAARAFLLLPEGVSPRQVIGPGGENCKWLVSETGVRFIGVTDEGISLGGLAPQVEAARRLLERQLRALQEGGKHTTSTCTNLCCAHNFR